MLTEKQKVNIAKLSNKDLKEILDICLEGLGVESWIHLIIKKAVHH
jgi:hypothetical protein